MITGFLESFTQWFIGIPGRFLLDVMNNNLNLFLTIISIYGLLLLYSKIIVRFYIPKRMIAFVLHKSNNDLINGQDLAKAVENLHEKWRKEIRNLPFYVVVPSKNEWWIKRPSPDYKNTKLLPYANLEEYEKSDIELIKEVMKKGLPIRE
ncbi:hypothetical protein SRABI84_04581 [Peribacillus simplex]|uniref:hypothetical protein n=1 Tax=Peribacillus simplex TaxID=1478 RepID=UPI001DEA0F65|nr:hypothetical protein [Peribacillus simplex]CAH0303103.1 hypothetical protein SRABI84_04581 [Peribacillus simplex]